jgi:hypothetical protein
MYRAMRCAPLAFALVVFLAPTSASAVKSCRTKIVSRTGAVFVVAGGVGADVRWGSFSGFNPATQGVPFFDQATCCAGGSCSKCHLGAPGTLAERTPPATCQLCLTELVGGTECCSILKSCSPGIRLRDASFAANDPRFESVETDPTLPTLRFRGVNVQIVDGSGATANPGSGTGNLIIGYNEDGAPAAVRTGSHNLIVGPEHSWTSYGGVVAGFENTVAGPYGSVLGGSANGVGGFAGTVTGGGGNVVDGFQGTISGGSGNVVDFFATNSSIGGGSTNTASGFSSSISGGSQNVIDGDFAWIGGGAQNAIPIGAGFASVSGGAANVASGSFASVSGGNANTASGAFAWVAGGNANAASGLFTAVSGGGGNDAAGHAAAVFGGSANDATGQFGTVTGGAQNTASGASSWAGGGELNVASGGTASVSGGAFNEAGPTHPNASVSGGTGVQAGGPGGAPDEWHAGAAPGFPTFGPPFGPGTY